jgi:hypothetical protein
LASYNTIQVSYEGFRVEPSLKFNHPCKTTTLEHAHGRGAW